LPLYYDLALEDVERIVNIINKNLWVTLKSKYHLVTVSIIIVNYRTPELIVDCIKTIKQFPSR
jgi:hypothetical protein